MVPQTTATHALALLVALVLVGSVSAATLYVPDDYGTRQSAVNAEHVGNHWGSYVEADADEDGIASYRIHEDGNKYLLIAPLITPNLLSE